MVDSVFIENLHIEYLADVPCHLPTVAQWHHEEWGRLAPGRTLDQRIGQLRERANKQGVPTAFVAIEHDKPVGSSLLVKCDMETRPNLEPWMAGVFVTPDFRSRGVGTSLVDRVVREARALGYSVIYLWTPDRADFYARRGWILCETTAYRGVDATVMSMVL